MAAAAAAKEGGLRWLAVSLLFFLSMVGHDYLQELLTRTYAFQSGILMTAVEFAACAVGPAVAVHARRGGGGFAHVHSIRAYALLVGCVLATATLANVALQFVSFPLKVVFKNAKLIPTMLLGAAVGSGRRYSCKDYAAAALLCAGVTVFTLADAGSSGAARGGQQQGGAVGVGVSLLAASVLAESTVPHVQERLMRRGAGGAPGAAAEEVMFYTNSMGFGALLLLAALDGDASAAGLGLLRRDPAALVAMLCFGATAYVGVACYMELVYTQGAVVAVVVATARKAITLILSFALFPKPVLAWHVGGGVCVMAGLLVSSIKLRWPWRQKQHAAAAGAGAGPDRHGPPKAVEKGSAAV